MESNGKIVGTINCTPTWEGVLPIIISGLKDGSDATYKNMMEELRNMAKTADKYNELIKKETDDPIGINLRSLLDGEIAMFNHSNDFNSYEERNKFIDRIEKRLKECNWISLSDGTTFEKEFVPGKK